MNDHDRPNLVRKYFIPTPVPPTGAYVKLAFAVAGLVMVILSAVTDSGVFAFLLSIGVIALTVSGARGFFRYQRMLSLSTPKATDQQMDAWLSTAIGPIVQTGIRRLNVHPTEVGTVREGRPWQLPFIGVPRTGEQSYARAYGADGRQRFSVYKIMVVYLSDWRLPVYTCFLDMATGATFAESTHEYALNHVGGMQTVSDRFTDYRPITGAQPAPGAPPPVVAHHTTFRAVRLMVSGQPAVELWISVADNERVQVDAGSAVSTASHDQYIAALREHLRGRNDGASAMNPGLAAGFAGPGQPGTPGQLSAPPGPLAMPSTPGATGPNPPTGPQGGWGFPTG